MNEDVYGCISELWCSPQDVDMERVKNGAGELVETLRSADERSAALLSRFLEELSISEEEYVELFELEPKCPLYLGSHVFDEPKTCAQAAISDRNDYMIELLGIYKHFGLTPDRKEMPDYLPMMVEFLGLTSGSRGDEVRRKLIREYMLPYLPAMRSRLEGLKTPYLHLLDALERVLNLDLEGGERHDAG